MKQILCIVMLFLVSFTLWAGVFMEVETRTLSGEDFLFPHDALKQEPAIFALAMSTNQKNGEQQQDELLLWHTYLIDSGMVPESMEIYHFPVIGSAPFFVRGLIRRGISASFVPTVRDDRAAVLFVRDTDRFARSAGIPLDDQPSLALVLPGGITAGYLKGPVNEENIEKLRKLLDAYLP